MNIKMSELVVKASEALAKEIEDELAKSDMDQDIEDILEEQSDEPA